MVKIIQFLVDRKKEKLQNINIKEIIKCKSALLLQNLIGKTTDKEPIKKFRGKDCGNISIRMDGDFRESILISGSQTSSKPKAILNDFVLVYNYTPKKFLVKCEGLIDPSSETPMHWSAYKADKNINAVIHAHIFSDDPLRKYVEYFFKKRNLPLLYSPSKYTRFIGDELIPLIQKIGSQKIIGMPIHDGGYGLLALGENLEKAYRKIIYFHKQLRWFKKSGGKL